MEQCLPSVLSVSANGEVRTIENECDLEGNLADAYRWPFAGGALTAHLKSDTTTGDSIGVTYCSNGPPAARVSVLSANGDVISSIIDLQATAQSMIHDCAITSSAVGDGDGYVLILD